MRKIKKSALLWIIENSRFVTIPLTVLVALSMLSSFCQVSFSVASRNVIDVATGVLPGSLKEKIIWLVILVVAQLIINISFTTLNVVITNKWLMRTKKNIFSILINKDLGDVSGFHSGEIINRMTNDLAVIKNLVVDILPELVSFVTKIIAAMWWLFKFDKSFAVIFVVVAPLILLCTRFYSKRMKLLHKKCQQSDGKVQSYLQEILQNLLVIKAFNNEKPVVSKLNIHQDENYKLKLKRNTISIIARVIMYVAFTFGYYFTLAWGAVKLSMGLMTFGTLTAMLQLVNQIQTPLTSLSNLLPQYYSAIASTERIMELTGIKDEPKLNKEFNEKEVYDKLIGIVFKNVSFSYDKEPIIKNADFIIEKGDFIGISGISGIGKSTILKILLGVLSPDGGELYIESGNEKYFVDSLSRKLFSYVPQGNMILSGTIRENLAFFRNDVSEEQIVSAAKDAEIYDFIKSLPEGFETVLGEKGLGLSEGQVQRLAIARALIYDAPILLLDEATSALDEETEAKVLKNIQSKNTKSCIFVSHKKAAFEISNKILEIENGTITLREL
ncbi:MAG: ABC transporter ATP-binding protein [Clostridia bacterium]|nr:ABC transporter ATP-binding protein [Clostridia bacterium]